MLRTVVFERERVVPHMVAGRIAIMEFCVLRIDVADDDEAERIVLSGEFLDREDIAVVFDTLQAHAWAHAPEKERS